MTFLKRRHSLAALSLCVLGCFSAHAQDYPSKSIRIIAPFPTGTGPDAKEICGNAAPARLVPLRLAPCDACHAPRNARHVIPPGTPRRP